MRHISDLKQSAIWHMTKDCQLLDSLDTLDMPLLRTYEWDSPSITYGHFIKPDALINLQKVIDFGISVAKRPTGGGLLFHGTDFAFTVAIPAFHKTFSRTVMNNYGLINSAVIRAVEKVIGLPMIANDNTPFTHSEFCMAGCSKFDVIYQGKKIGGAAQRTTKHGLIHQSSLFLVPPDWAMLFEIVQDEEAIKQMQSSSNFLFEHQDMPQVRETLTSALKQELTSVLSDEMSI